METSQIKPTKKLTVLLSCPGIHLAPTVVTAEVEDAVIDTMVNGEDPTEWDVQSARTYGLSNRLWDADGEIILAAHGEELWSFYKDPHGVRQQYQQQIDTLVDSFIELNREAFQALYDGFVIKDIKVAKAFKNKWLLIAEVTDVD